jgi:hypothetical protein
MLPMSSLVIQIAIAHMSRLMPPAMASVLSVIVRASGRRLLGGSCDYQPM